MNTHKAKMHKLPANAEPSKKKWLYCKDCVGLFWCQTQYNNHFKRCNKSSENEKSADAEVKVEPADSGEEIVEFKTIQHKCEFCLSVFYTKKLFDMHIAKNHPDHMEEYGIVPDPALELVNDSEDLMGNLISGGIYDVEKCKKLSAMPVVSLKRYRGTKQSVILGKDGEVTDDEPESEQQKVIENVAEAVESSVGQDGDEAEKMDNSQETENQGEDQNDQQKGGNESTTVIQEVTDQKGEVLETLDEHDNVLAGIKITENFDDDSEEMAGIVITKNTDESFEDISEVNETKTPIESMEDKLHQSEGMEVDDNISEKAIKDIELATVEEDGKMDREENLPDEGISEEVEEAETEIAAVSEDSKDYGENISENTGSEVKTIQEVKEKFEVVESQESANDAEEPQSTVVEDEAGVSNIESGEELVRDESPALVSYDDVSGNSEGEENGDNNDEIIASETVEDVDIDSNIQVDSVELGQSDNNTTDSDDIMPLPQVYRQNEMSASPELVPTDLVNEQTDNTEAEGNEMSNEIDSVSVGLEQTVTDDYNLVGNDVAVQEKSEDVPSYDAINEEQL